MRRLLRWLGFAAAGLAAVAIVAALVLYGLSERALRRTFALPSAAAARTFTAALPTDSTSLAEGRRLATIRGCYEGCHGMGISGGVFIDEPILARLVAPDLTAAARRYSNAELERIIRWGVRPNGRSVVGMPSEMYHGLSDADLGRVLARIRRTPPLGRLGLVLGKYHPAAVLALRITAAAPLEAPAAEDSLALGRYLAQTSCTECHGLDLRGGDGTPALAIAAAYGPEEFRHFFRTGQAKGGRELALMSKVARSRFSYFMDGEVRALHAYLRTLPRQSAASGAQQ
jgi:cytochrome c553